MKMTQEYTRLLTVTFKADAEFINKLDWYASRKGLNRSEAIRNILEEAINRELENIKTNLTIKIEKQRVF